jgi:hypothetical protein
MLRFEDDTVSKPPNIPITFLRNYTDPSLRSVSDAFVLSAAHAESTREETTEELYFGFNRLVSYTHDNYMDDLFSGVFSDFCKDQTTEAIYPALIPASLPLPPLTPSRIDALLSILATQHDLSPNAFAFPAGRFPIDLARAVFTSNNIVQYITAFFTYFHPHTPFIHWPSFNIGTVSLPLLLAISLLGSVFAAPQDDALSARYFFELGEEYVFGLLHQIGTVDNYADDEHIQILQAIVLMHALQMDSNNDGIRLRIRTHRFPAIVAVLRRLDMFGAVRTTRFGAAGSRVAEEAVYRTADTFAEKSSENLFAPSTVTSPGVVLGDLNSTSSVTRGEDWDRFIADEVKIRYDIRLQTLYRMDLTYT